MVLFSICQAKKLNYVVLVFAFLIFGCVEAESNETSKALQTEEEKPAVAQLKQKSVKKELKIDLAVSDILVNTPREEIEDHTEKVVIIDKESVTESSGKGVEQQPVQLQDSEKGDEKPMTLTAEHHQHHEDEDFVISDENDISESLKTGFYFFLILSSAAVVFIIFKIYRLRLSRAERKYGVQGDNAMQELTPLPVSLEDAHSDDEDQTLFEIQRHNIRIL